MLFLFYVDISTPTFTRSLWRHTSAMSCSSSQTYLCDISSQTYLCDMSSQTHLCRHTSAIFHRSHTSVAVHNNCVLTSRPETLATINPFLAHARFQPVECRVSDLFIQFPLRVFVARDASPDHLPAQIQSASSTPDHLTTHLPAQIQFANSTRWFLYLR